MIKSRALCITMSGKISTRERGREKCNFILANGMWNLLYDKIWPHLRYRRAICRGNGHSRRAFTPSVRRLRHPVLHQPLHCVNPIWRVRIYDEYYSHPQPRSSLYATLPFLFGHYSPPLIIEAMYGCSKVRMHS